MRYALPAIFVIALVSLLYAQRTVWSTAAAGRGPALDEIRGEDLAAHLRFLSHDLLEGRAPSTRGGTLAAEYLAALARRPPDSESGALFCDIA